MEKIVSSLEELTLNDGNTVTLTMNFARLLYLRGHGREKEVAAGMGMLNARELDMLDCPKLFYCAYLCANEEPAYTFEEFTALIPFDLEICAKLFQKLTTSKKK